MARCALGKVVVNDTFSPRWEFGTDIEGCFLYIADGEHRFLLAEFDFSEIWRSTCHQWREGISRETGIPVESIWLHTTQNHTGPGAPDLDGEPCGRLIERSASVIQSMIAGAEEAELSYAIVDLEGRFNFNREVYVPQLGAVTAWAGALQTDRGDYPCTQDPSRLLLCGYEPDIPAFEEPIRFDRPCDPLAALLVFRGESKRVLGSLLRFTGHPDIAVSATKWGKYPERVKYNHDWPGYARRKLDEALGGDSLCVGGPCGNVGMRFSGPDTYDQAAGLARDVGEGVADACLEAWRAREPAWEPLQLGPLAATEVRLPLRDGLPRSRAEIPHGVELEKRLHAESDKLRAAIERGEAPARVKRIIDRLQATQHLGAFLDEFTNLSDEELAGRYMTIDLEAVRVNDLVLAGLPGETMTETSMRLQAQTLGRQLITIDQVNGYHLYITDDDAHVQGGYSYWGGLIARGAEPMLRRSALELIDRVGPSADAGCAARENR
jgi:hypothetical protein